MKLKKIIKFFFIILFFPIYAKPTLNIYTYHSFSLPYGPGEKIKISFEKKCDCEVKFISVGNSMAILNRLILEGKNSRADIAIGLDSNIMQKAEETGLFTKFYIKNNKLNLIKKWKNIFFIPYDYSYLSLIYNTKRVKNPPKSLKEFIYSSIKNNLIYQDPRTSTLGLGWILWVNNIFKKDINQVWEKIAEKTVTVTKGWIDSYNLFLKGESDFLLGYNTSILHFINQNKYNFDTVDFSEGHYKQIEIAGQLINSPNPKIAEKFMQFILSKEFQEIIANNNFMYPILNIKLPYHFKMIKIPRNILEQKSNYYNHDIQNRWIKVWQNAVQ